MLQRNSPSACLQWKLLHEKSNSAISQQSRSTFHPIHFSAFPASIYKRQAQPPAYPAPRKGLGGESPKSVVEGPVTSPRPAAPPPIISGLINHSPWPPPSPAPATYGGVLAGGRPRRNPGARPAAISQPVSAAGPLARAFHYRSLSPGPRGARDTRAAYRRAPSAAPGRSGPSPGRAGHYRTSLYRSRSITRTSEPLLTPGRAVSGVRAARRPAPLK